MKKPRLSCRNAASAGGGTWDAGFSFLSDTHHLTSRMPMKTGDRLLAKSYDRGKYGKSPPDYAPLRQHSRDVAQACDALAKAVGRTALYNALLPDEMFDHFRLTLRANGWFQDLGKASSHFQEMVSGASEIRQLLRHETISALLLWKESRFREW